MAWLFNQSETNKLLSQIREKLEKCDGGNLAEILSTSEILTNNQKMAMKTLLDKAIDSYLYYEPQLKQVVTNTDNHVQSLAKKEEIKKLADRCKDVVCQIHNAKEPDFIQIMLSPGFLSDAQHNNLVSFISKQIVNFLANMKEDDLRQVLANLGNYKQVTETNRKKAEDINLLRHKGAVKANIISLENLMKNPPKRPTQIITTRSVAIPEAFTKKMQDIHTRKLGDLKFSTDERIRVRETYSNGIVRMSGFKLKGEYVGLWRWWNQNGELIGEYNYLNKNFFYTTTKKKTIRHNTNPEIETDPEFIEWLGELRY